MAVNKHAKEKDDCDEDQDGWKQVYQNIMITNANRYRIQQKRKSDADAAFQSWLTQKQVSQNM